MIPNFVFTDEVGKIEQTAKNTVLTNHYSIWKQYKINGKNLYDIECPDIYAGEIDDGVMTDIFFNPSDRKNKQHLLPPDRNSSFKTIVIILESPHLDEYKDHSFINPALGTTGENLQNYFEKLINALAISEHDLKNGQYRIILMESIQYQCSLGIKPLNKNIRNLVFSEIWNLQNKNGEFPTKNDFISRLASYMPDVILNLCTTPSNNLVQKEIEQYRNKYPSVKLYIGCHPSSWHRYDKEKNTYTDEYQKIWKLGEKDSNPITF
jgi:hypothetical protein